MEKVATISWVHDADPASSRCDPTVGWKHERLVASDCGSRQALSKESRGPVVPVIVCLSSATSVESVAPGVLRRYTVSAKLFEARPW